MKITLIVFALLLLAGVAFTTSAQPNNRAHNLMPVPASLQWETGRLLVTDTFTVAVRGHNDARLVGGIERMMRRLGQRTAATFAPGLSVDVTTAALVIECQSAGKAIPSVDEDESYALNVNNKQVVLKAKTVVGALRGLETLLQLLEGDAQGFYFPAVQIDDRPRFPWRGLMIDIGRHWQPMEVIKRNLDGMAAVKLNVLHLHITEDQGFRIESKWYPRLHTLGSDGNFYTQEQMREIIAYARMRGIRVVPEFDMPGHTTSWFVGHPELASRPGPYEIERHWGIFEPVMDPTNEKLYELLDGFLGEMAALFPDAYLHIGGDEVEGKHWKESARIQAFIKEKGLKDNHGLQAYFNRRVLAIVQKHGKRMIGWDEILAPDLPKDAMIQSWRGPENLAKAAKQGYSGILSNGYYIDLMESTARHYVNDPAPAGTALTAEEQKLILGGEATMWSEWVAPETIDSRIWPRTAAIAERLWSPREVNDVNEMYRRLAVVSNQLEDVGLLHQKNRAAMLRRWVGGVYANSDFLLEPLTKFIALLEPVKGYRRGRMQQATQFTPLTKLVDLAVADSEQARGVASLVDQLLNLGERARPTDGPNGLHTENGTTQMLRRLLVEWNEIHTKVIGAVDLENISPNGKEAIPLLEDLLAASLIGREALDFIESGKLLPPALCATRLAHLDAAARPKAAVELMIVQPIKELVIAAAEQEKRKTMSAEEWKKMVKQMAAPKKEK